MIGIYKITNKVNGKCYIGQSINIDKRIKEHFWKATCEKDVSFNSILHQAIRKYGKDNFICEVLQECSIEDIDKLEQQYIKEYNSVTPYGYNIMFGGQKVRALPHLCQECGKPLGDSRSILCITCAHKKQQRCERPSKEELKDLIRTESFVSIGEAFHVSDNSIRKWCLAYNLPKTKKEINQYTDEEWNNI